MAISEIHPWARNPRKISERAIAKVARSIQEFGFTNPILVRTANGEIIAGHTRFKAAKRLGRDRVLIRRLDLSEKEAHKLAIVDNRTGEEAEWDDVLLSQQIERIKADGEDLSVLAFDDTEVDAIIARAKKAGEAPMPDRADVDGDHGDDGGSGEPGEDGPPDGDKPTRGGNGLGKPVVSYSIVFDDEVQQTRWYAFLRQLKASYPNAGSVGERLVAFIDAQAA